MSFKTDQLKKINEALDQVKSDKHPNDWLLISYVGDSGNSLELKKDHTGVGGLKALKAQLVDSQVQYGIVRINYDPDNESTRIKYAVIVWLGPDTKMMRKARASIDKAAVMTALGTDIRTFTCESQEDIDETSITAAVQGWAGANYNGGRG